MSMQDGSRPLHGSQKQVQCRFSRGTTCSLDHRSFCIDTHEIVRRQRPFVYSRSCYRQKQRLAPHHGTEITTRTQGPPSRVAFLSDLGQECLRVSSFEARFSPNPLCHSLILLSRLEHLRSSGQRARSRKKEHRVVVHEQL